MNVKIKDEAYCIITEKNYDQVFFALQRHLGEKERQLFAERAPGSTYLQWTLPGDGWIALSKGDPLMEQLVRKELAQLQQNVCAQFGKNQEMALKLLSVPSDDYIYYKPDENGGLMIKLTAWGYRFPERVGTDITGVINPKPKTEHISISFVYNEEPVPNQALRLNGFSRTADSQGVLDVGDLPIGYQFDIEVGDERRHVTVMPEQGKIVIDMTEYVTVEVRVLLDGAPYAGAEAELSYLGQHTSLTCDGNGCASARLPLDKNGSFCKVSVKDSFQQKILQQTDNVFTFQLSSPPPPPPPEPTETTVEVKATLNGEPYAGAKASLSYGNKQLELICDEQGYTQTRLPFTEGGLCQASIDGIFQQKILKESGNVFVFRIEKQTPPPPPPPLVKEATVEVRVTRDGMPAADTKVTLSYMDRQMDLICDKQGRTTVQLPLNEQENFCKVSVENQVRQELLQEGINLFEFHFRSVVSPELPKKMPWWMYLLEILAALLLIGLLCLTFWFCGDMLFGGMLK